MARALRPLLILSIAVACGGDRAPRNDTVVVDDSLPDDPANPPRVSTWNRAAGALFAVRSGTGPEAWIVNPEFAETQALDTLTETLWNVEGDELALFDGGQMVGTGRVFGFHYDSICAGWPTATLLTDSATSASWRVAFPPGTVEGLPFDSLPALAPADSAARARSGALAASRAPNDTIAAFHGRPFTIRQASRFPVGGDTMFTMYEVVRLVAQEANPLQEQLLIITQHAPATEPVNVFFEREVGAEESMGSIELLGVFRVRAGGRVAILVRRDREAGFMLEWIERTARGAWRVRWRSATDGC